jgi:mannose-6-phosphate isomerase-like protein (cupin superfamily)
VGDGAGWHAVAIDDVEAVPWQGTELTWRPVRHALGARVAGISAYTAEHPGQVVVEPHDEASQGRGHEEVYVVLRGRATFTLDDEALDAPAGTLVRVSPPVRRSAVATEPGTAVLALGGPPEFEPAGSEWIERARPFLRRDPARARALLDDLRAERPQSPAIEILEALIALAGGDRDAAGRLVADVVRRHPDLREPLGDDPDLRDLVERGDPVDEQ